MASVITQCSIRHLYTLSSIPHPQKEALIAVAKGMERRRCNHHGLENPLSTLECFSSVIDPKNSRTNKNCYVVASQDEEVRRYCRAVKGVPLVYVKRSVMVMEPMAESSVGVREGIERGKFRMGLRGKGQAVSLKRKRGDSSDAETGNAQEPNIPNDDNGAAEERAPKKKKIRGPKGPNPLSVKKPRKGKENKDGRAKESKDLAEAQEVSLAKTKQIETDHQEASTIDVNEEAPSEPQKPPAKRKRKRKHKTALLAALGDKNDDDDAENIE